MSYSIIAAVGRERQIGVKGKLPWHLPDDLKRFKELTFGHTVIMGRNTYESIGHPLTNRRNIVVSSDPNFDVPPECMVVRSLNEAMGLTKADGEVFIIGGAKVFEQALPYTDKMYLTIVDETFPEADTFFPILDLTEWRVVQTSVSPKTKDNPFSQIFVLYERRKNQ